jgi:formylglycine-generating enzyme required for sulfatase activity
MARGANRGPSTFGRTDHAARHEDQGRDHRRRVGQSDCAENDPCPPANSIAETNFAEIAPTNFQYRVAGDFSRNGKQAEAPLRSDSLTGKLKIMTRQVTAAEYANCVDDGGCPRIAFSPDVTDRPVVGVSWHDATAYTKWMTRKTGILHRLPTDHEWVFAAGEKATDEVLPLIDAVDPSQAWIARYEAEANRAQPAVRSPQPIGTFGSNKYGLKDVAGNVWEWTNTCFSRVALESAGEAHITNTNCGVRVVQGAHRTYMADFIRDPRTGGCAAGVPPANLGFRIVVEDEKWPTLQRMVSAVLRQG